MADALFAEGVNVSRAIGDTQLMNVSRKQLDLQAPSIANRETAASISSILTAGLTARLKMSGAEIRPSSCRSIIHRPAYSFVQCAYMSSTSEPRTKSHHCPFCWANLWHRHQHTISPRLCNDQRKLTVYFAALQQLFGHIGISTRRPADTALR